MKMNSINLEQLIREMNDNKLVIFVGAGISKNAGLPDWKEVIQPFKKRLEYKGEDDYLRIAETYYRRFGEEEYFKEIRNAFEGIENSLPHKIHDLIGKIYPDHIITTNYDYLLENSLNKEEKKYDVIASNDDLLCTDNIKHDLIKMHGDFKHKNIVFKESDYESWEKNFAAVSNKITTHLADHTILYIGYSLRDSTYKNLIKNVSEIFKGNSKTSYFFSPFELDENDVSYYKPSNIEMISGNLNVDATSDEIGAVTEKFLAKLLENKNEVESENKEFYGLFSELSEPASNVDGIWKNVEFLNKLSFVEAQDVFKFSNISKIGLLYPSNQVISKSEEADALNVSSNSSLTTFLEMKTSIDSFFDFKINERKPLESNAISSELNNAFHFYKEHQYALSIKMFKEISEKALEAKDYWKFFVCEFNLQHINIPFSKINSRSSEIIDETIKEIIHSKDFNNIRLSHYFREIILSFKFIYRKLYKINNLLDRIRNERINYLNGGTSSNNSLYTLNYEFFSLIDFIEVNCIAIYQYSEFQNVVSRYFECLLIAMDNSLHESHSNHFFSGTSTVIKQINKKELQYIIPYLPPKNIPTLLNSYHLKNIMISEEGMDYILESILELCESLKQDYNNENMIRVSNYIKFLYHVNIDNVNNLISIFQQFPLLQVSVGEIKIILELLVNHKEKINNSENLCLILFQHLEKIISSDLYNTHSRNFYLYANLIEFFNFDSQEEFKIVKNTFLQILENEEKIKDIEKYAEYLIYFYNFFPDDLKSVIVQILFKYEGLADEEFNEYFTKGLLINGVFDFPIRRRQILNNLALAINNTEERTEIITYPDPKQDALKSILFSLEKGSIQEEELKEFIDFDNLRGVIPEADWIFFDNYSDQLLELLLKKNKFSTLYNEPKNTEEQLHALEKWLIKNYKNGYLDTDPHEITKNNANHS